MAAGTRETASPFTVIVPLELLDTLLSSSRLAAADGGGEDPSSAAAEDGEDISPAVEHVQQAPIWQQPPRLLGFTCERPVAKALGKLMAERLGGGNPA